MDLTRRVNLNERSERKAMRKLIKREKRAGNIAQGVDARAAVEAMRQAQNNGQYFDNTGHKWTEPQIEPLQIEVPMLGLPGLNDAPLIGLNQVNHTPQQRTINRTPVINNIQSEYSKSNPHPRYNDVPSTPYKVPQQQAATQQSSPQRKEWFQYGIGSNAVPDKTPEEIEADRLEMNRRVKKAIRNFLWGIPNYHYIGGYDTNVDGQFIK